MLAVEFGKKYKACKEGTKWRESLPPATTQAEAWLLCPRADWLAWMIEARPVFDKYDKIMRETTEEIFEQEVLDCPVESELICDFLQNCLDGKKPTRRLCLKIIKQTPRTRGAVLARVYLFLGCDPAYDLRLLDTYYREPEDKKKYADIIREKIPVWPGC